MKLVIVGGVAGGATAAARARRVDEHADIILLERGEFVSFANCGLPYYLGGKIKERDDLLVATPEFLSMRFRIDVRTFSEAVAVDRKAKKIRVRNIRTGEEHDETYDKLILAPGAEPIVPPLEGIGLESIFRIRTVPDIDRVKAWVDGKKPGRAVVVGGGFIGLEMAENLVLRGVKTTIVEMLDQVMAPIDYEMAALVHKHLREKGVELRLKDGVKSFRAENGATVVTTSSGGEIECDLVILAIGVRAETELARKAGLEIGRTGGIRVDQTLRTSDPDIFAVGDAVEITDFATGAPAIIPLAGPANKQGRIAADNALGRHVVYKGTQGTAVVKVFDLTVASTGASEKRLKSLGAPHLASWTHSMSNASYYPGASMMAVKLIFSPVSGKVLGAQIVGRAGVDKRIDVLATVVRAGMTVFDLEELELAYAPPFSSAKDPVNMAGFTAANILRGDLAIVDWRGVDELKSRGCVMLDVRTEKELGAGSIPGHLHIPVDQLRARLGELDKSKTYIPYCAISLRGYVAHRILAQNGFTSKVLSGGWRTYCAAESEAAGDTQRKCPY